jgi:hypothetical protein
MHYLLKLQWISWRSYLFTDFISESTKWILMKLLVTFNLWVFGFLGCDAMSCRYLPVFHRSLMAASTLPARLHGIIIQNTIIKIFVAVKTLFKSWNFCFYGSSVTWTLYEAQNLIFKEWLIVHNIGIWHKTLILLRCAAFIWNILNSDITVQGQIISDCFLHV